jgi:hypothetical protein
MAMRQVPASWFDKSGWEHANMDVCEIIHMLVEAERALQRHDCATAYAAVLDAESKPLCLERDFLASRDRNLRKTAQMGAEVDTGRLSCPVANQILLPSRHPSRVSRIA